MNYTLRTFSYSCTCGYSIRVFCDAGIPVEKITCKRCGHDIKRVALQP